MIDTYFKKFFWTFNLLVLFAAAFLVARSVNAFVGKALSTPPEKIAKKQSKPDRARRNKSQQRVSLTAFLDRNLFKAAREDIIPEPENAGEGDADSGEFDPDRCEPSSLSANLLATVVSSDPEGSVCVFEDTGKKEISDHRIGDKVMEQAEVVAIEWRRVLVKRNGRCESFALDEVKKPSKRTSSYSPPSTGGKSKKPQFGKGVKKVSEGEYEIPRAEIDNVLSNLNQIATQARIVPSFHNGKANGFKLFSIRPGSLYSKIGIQNGDIIQRINGYEINSPDKALEIYSKLKDATSITVDLVRRGKTKSLAYGIR